MGEAAPQRRRDAGRRHASFRDLKGLGVDDWCAFFRIDRHTIDAGARDRLRWALSSLRERRYRDGEELVLDEDMVVVVEGTVEVDDHLVTAPFYCNERALSRLATVTVPQEGTTEPFTYRVASDRGRCYVVSRDDAALLRAAGGFDADRTRSLRSLERRLAGCGVDAQILIEDPVFAAHATADLARRGDAEPLRFLGAAALVTAMHERPFVEVLQAWDGLWKVYIQPWDSFADVSAVAGDATTRRHLADARVRAVQRADVGRLLDAVAVVAATVKQDLDTRFLPAFVASEAYAAFVRERFPSGGRRERARKRDVSLESLEEEAGRVCAIC